MEKRIMSIHPNELFNQLELKKDGQIQELWDVQTEVLDKYFKNLKDLKKVAIELPTGSGKSIISLLILEMWRRTGKRVAILTSSIALSNDMKRRCDDLDIPSVVITGKRESTSISRSRIRNLKDYKRKKSVGIMNYWAYMLGKDIAMPEVLIIDDADSFENLLIDQYSLVITKANDPDIYQQILNELSKYRVYQRLETLSFMPSSEDTQLIYFPHAFEMSSKLRKILQFKDSKAISKDLFWSFDRNKDRIHTYLMFVSKWDIVLTPYIITGSMHERIRRIPHIIYTSATLGTAERIHKTMGSFDNIEILSERDIKSKVNTMGKRIIFPLDDISTTGKMDDSILKAIQEICQTFVKTLVLCNSKYHAKKLIGFLKNQGHKVTLYKKESDSTRFAGDSEGVLVAAGRFVGLDLPGKACQVGIIPRLPYVFGPVDLLTKNILEDQQYTDEKVSHRLVQAVGRCNRNPNDSAVYFILDSRLASDILGDENVFQHFPSLMKAELDFGQEFTEIGGLYKAIEIGQKLLNNKFPDFARDIDERVERDNSQNEKLFKKPFLREIRGWYDLTERLSYLDAAQKFLECLNFYNDSEESSSKKDRQIAWLHYAVANCNYLAWLFFRNIEYKNEAIKHLKSAMKYGSTSWFSGLQIVINQLNETEDKDDEAIFNLETQSFKESLLRKWNDFSRTNSVGTRNPYQKWEQMREILLNGTHDAVCETLENVLELMGFEISNPKRTPGAPDLILFSDYSKRYISIIEIKTKETSDTIKRDNVDQIGGHKTNYQEKYPDRPIFPLLFTNKTEIGEIALSKAKGNVRILRSQEFSILMNKYFELMEKGWNITNPSERLAFMEKIPTLDKFKIIFEAEDPVVSVDEINQIF